MQVRGDKIVFPDGTKQTTAYDPSKLPGKDEQAAKDKAQDERIQENADNIALKVEEAPHDGNQYARQNYKWSKVNLPDGGITDAPKDGKTYGRKDEGWAEVSSDAYSKAEMDAQQLAQDAEIAKKADKATTYTKTEVDSSQNAQDTKIDKNTGDIAQNKLDIEKNKTDLETLADDVDALTGSVIYKGSLNATVTPAPAGATVGDMYINEYNVDDPATNYPVASGWAPVTEVKYDDKLIKTDSGWDKIESVVGVPSYTAGEIDALLDDKADKTDVYTKTEIDAQQTAQDEAIQDVADAVDLIPEPLDSYTKDETDTLLDNKADKSDTYTKAETYNTSEIDDKLDDKADTATTYTKIEVDAQQKVQDDKIEDNTTAIDVNTTNIDKKADKEDTYTKDEINSIVADLEDSITAGYKSNTGVTTGRNPEEGKLYLLYGMNMSLKYTEVTRIYISATDGEGFVREFDKILPDDKVQLVSSNGSGQYKITTITGMDSNTYYELGVENLVSDGTLSDNEDIEVKLEINALLVPGVEEAPSDGKQYGRQDREWTEVIDSFEEAPEDGKQYARKDATWSEVEATGGGTVANGCIYLNNQTIDDDYTIPVGKNGMSAGAIEFNGTVTVPTGSKYHVVDSTPSGGGVVSESIWTEVDGKAVYDGDIKVNDVTVGRGSGTGNNSIVMGRDTLISNPTGGSNTALGVEALKFNVAGNQNTAVGRRALNLNESGSNNTGVGTYALSKLTTGTGNTTIGTSSGGDLTTGSNNIVIGHLAKASAEDVSNEVTIGNDNVTKTRLKGNVTSTTFFNALGDGTAGGIQFKDGNALIARIDDDLMLKSNGAEKMRLTADGVSTIQDMKINNVPIGSGPSGAGRGNIAIGGDALFSQTAGAYSVALGWKTLSENVDADYNTAIGGFTLNKAKAGNNTALGYRAGDSLVNGGNNTLIGYAAQPSSPTVSNEVTIGNDNVVDTRLRGRVLLNDNWNGGSENKNGLGIKTSTTSSTAYAMYIRNSNNDLLYSIRCDGSTRASKLYLGDDKVDLRAELNLKDKLIEKLEARLTKLEARIK